MFDRRRIEKQQPAEEQPAETEQQAEPQLSEREQRLRQLAHERKWDIRKKPRINKWFWVLIGGFVAYLILQYVVRGALK